MSADRKARFLALAGGFYDLGAEAWAELLSAIRERDGAPAPLVGADDAAAAIGVSRDTFDRHVAPEAPHTLIGARRMYEVAELRRFLAGRVEAPASRGPVALSRPRRLPAGADVRS